MNLFLQDQELFIAVRQQCIVHIDFFGLQLL